MLPTGEKKASESGTTLETMSDLALKQVQRKLEKDKTEVEWKLKEYGWRLDQAAAVSVAKLMAGY